jgi:hypothetical protein
MDCQNVQAAIDAAIDVNVGRAGANETIGAHLGSCRDCRRYSDESAVLLTMLGAQPSIEAPADFDFKLRARLARAQSEPAAANAKSFGFSWSGFSWGQAAAATAALAVVATVTALHVSTSDRTVVTKVNQTNYPVAEKVAASVAPPVTNARAVTAKTRLSVKTGQRASAVTPISATLRTDNLNLATESEDSTEGKDYIWRGYDPETGQFVTTQNRALIGAENSASTMSKNSSFVASI